MVLIAGVERVDAWRRRLLAGAALLALSIASYAQGSQIQQVERLRRGWSMLREDEQRESMEALRAELATVDTLQQRLVRAELAHLEQDRGFFPAQRERTWFEPSEHVPAKHSVPRRAIAPEDPRTAELRAQLELLAPDAPLRAYAYDWATRSTRSVLDEREPQHLFENALRGLWPDGDLVEALLLARFDRGEVQKTLVPFEHCYTDRQGNAYLGISLFEAWTSENEFETPDIDSLGLFHVLFDDRQSFSAPVPPNRQKALYARLGEELTPARRYRQLREALAALYLRPEPSLPAAYAASVERLHALWSFHQNDSRALAAALPVPEGWELFLENWATTTNRNGSMLETGRLRQQQLAYGQRVLRAALDEVLESFGAFERKERPAPLPPAPAPTPVPPLPKPPR